MKTATKQSIEDFAVGDRVENTQQLSYFYKQRGRVTELSRNSLRIVVLYDSGSGEVIRSGRVWLQKVKE